MNKTYDETVKANRRKTMLEFVFRATYEELASLLDAAEMVANQFGPDYPKGIVADLVRAVARVKHNDG